MHPSPVLLAGPSQGSLKEPAPADGDRQVLPFWTITNPSQVLSFSMSVYTNYGDGTVTPIRTASNTAGTAIRVGRGVGSKEQAIAITPAPQGYRLGSGDGGVFSFGGAGFHGSLGSQRLNAPIVGVAATADGRGYWLVASDGGVFNFGDAGFHGSMGGQHVNAPMVGVAATADGRGYWLVASDGGVFNFGDAGFHGSMGSHHLNAPIVGMTTTTGTKGYWLVASDGGAFNFGDAGFHGSIGGQHLNAPIIGVAPTTLRPPPAGGSGE